MSEQPIEEEASKIIASIEDMFTEELAHRKLDVLSQVSTAISMKRIADVIAGTPENYNLVQAVYNAILELKINRN